MLLLKFYQVIDPNPYSNNLAYWISTSVEGYVRRVERVTEFVKGKMESFTPREKVERVRNCTKIGSDIINEIGKNKLRRINAK